ncbi:MAG: hypothetical protein QG608_2233 [Actinomycetota bacterium]|nr:hypothetical protein [Actinomycetota bacterium]
MTSVLQGPAEGPQEPSGGRPGPAEDRRPGVAPETGQSTAVSWSRRALLVAVSVLLSLVIIAPIALSSQDLVRWAESPTGLDLSRGWAWLVFIALDAAAATCVAMTVHAATRGESGGMFHVLTWMFAAGSALANYRHGTTTTARDDEIFFPAMSLTGPLLLDVTLARMRRWIRTEDGRQLAARPRFGARWMPGVAFRSTFRAWRVALREGIDKPADAIAHVRETEALRQLPPMDQLQYALYVLNSYDMWAARRWLQARGVVIRQETVDAVLAALPSAPARRPLAAPQARRPVAAAQARAALTAGEHHRAEPDPVSGAVPASFTGSLPVTGPIPTSDLSTDRTNGTDQANGTSQSNGTGQGSVPLPGGSAPEEYSDQGFGAEPDAEPESDVTAMTKRDALRYALQTLGTWDVPTALEWLAERGVSIDRRDAHRVSEAAQRQRAELTAVSGESRGPWGPRDLNDPRSARHSQPATRRPTPSAGH